RVAKDAGRASRTTPSPMTMPSSTGASSSRGHSRSVAFYGRVSSVDLDAFSDVHSVQWARLDALSRRRRLTGAESDELVRLYQAVATHLSIIRSSAPDPVVVSRLSETLNRARTTIGG